MQALLSQFSQKTKAMADASEDAEDEAAFVDLEDEIDESAESNEVADEEEEADEIDPSVEASDAAIIEEVALEVDEQDDVPTLTRAEVNLGRFAVTKVSPKSPFAYDAMCCSHETTAASKSIQANLQQPHHSC